ncbi:hypothetical protein BJ508DRAFT_139972 [Ascobolus immersus RN42]|uniref:Uncharacterized protein n=1 Tax=Ascobolus immersus RN42 TaxID=1160509 RepID=A0A3N4I4H2_ASCIM|nr:hypothetical protein BJ508DRAFT_139972 [Ascobolus immersus RN42]
MVVQNASATPHFPSTRPPFPSLLPLSQFFQNAPAPPQLGSPIDHQDSSIHHQYPALPQIPEIPLKHYTIKDVLEEVISVDVNLINGIKAAIPRETFITFMVLLSRFRNTELDVHELDSAITSLLAPWPTSLVTPGPELVRAIRQFIPEWYKQCIMMQTEVSRESATEKLERLREDYLAIERLKWELKDIDRRESEMEREYEETEESVKRLQMRKMELEKMAMDMVRKYRR